MLEKQAAIPPSIGEFIAHGSSRAVYESDPGTVLKIALNKAGIIQNRTEYTISAQYPELPIAKVLQHSPGYEWLQMEHAKGREITAFSKTVKKVAKAILKIPNTEKDFSSDNFGRIRNKIVAIDYGYTRDIAIAWLKLTGETIVSLYDSKDYYLEHFGQKES